MFKGFIPVSTSILRPSHLHVWYTRQEHQTLWLHQAASVPVQGTRGSNVATHLLSMFQIAKLVYTEVTEVLELALIMDGQYHTLSSNLYSFVAFNFSSR